MKEGICATHMLAILVVYKEDSHNLLEKNNKEERTKTKKRQINQGKNDNEKTREVVIKGQF